MTTEHHAVTELVLAVFRVHQALVAEGDRRVAGLDLNSARWKVLGAIQLAEAPLTASEIARRMGLSRQGAQKQLDQLCAEELVVRNPNPAHRRAPLFTTTPRGRSAFAAADRIWARWSRLLGQGIAASTWREAAALLDTLTHRIEAHAEESP